MLISPAEPKSFYPYGKVSSIPEKWGVDFWWPHKQLVSVGVQRKTIMDLLASMDDGRLARELAQMKRLGLGVFMIEGEARWTNDGMMSIQRRSITRAQWRGILLSLQSQGYWLMETLDTTDSIESLSQLKEYLGRSTPSSLMSRPKATGGWGKASNRDWGIHLLQSFEGVGQGTAIAIYDHFQGVPLQWTVTEKEMLGVKGVGKGRVKEMMEAFGERSGNGTE